MLLGPLASTIRFSPPPPSSFFSSGSSMRGKEAEVGEKQLPPFLIGLHRSKSPFLSCPFL